MSFDYKPDLTADNFFNPSLRRLADAINEIQGKLKEEQSGSKVVNFALGFPQTVVFDTPFATSCDSVVATNGDAATGIWICSVANKTKTGFDIYAYNDAGVAGAGLFRVDYIAKGM